MEKAALASEPISSAWKTSQVFVMAVICLAVGIASGYLLRGPAKTVPVTTPPAAEQQQMGEAGSMPSPEQIQKMAGKMAEPLLAELQKDPNNPDLLGKVASVYMRSQQYPLAAEYLEKAAKAKPTADGYVALSNAYHFAQADDKAMGALNEALKLDPKSANALFNLGMLDWQVKNDPQSAIDAWQKLLKANPNHPKRAQVENYIAKAKKHMTMDVAK